MLTELRGISADFEGCEIRVAAALSGDMALYEAETGAKCHRCGEYAYDDQEWQPCSCGFEVKDGKQVLKAHKGLHWLTAHTAKGPDAVKEDRYNAKRGTFTRLFGGGPATAADQVGTEKRVMEELFEAFNQVAPVFTAWDYWLKDCYKQGVMMWRDYATGQNWSQDIPGRSDYMIYRTYSGRNVYITNGAHAAGNGAIQGTARELIVDGINRWRYTRWGKLPLLPIHDECMALVPRDEAEEARRALGDCMASDVLSSPGFPVHITTDTDDPWSSWQDSS